MKKAGNARFFLSAARGVISWQRPFWRERQRALQQLLSLPERRLSELLQPWAQRPWVQQLFWREQQQALQRLLSWLERRLSVQRLFWRERQQVLQQLLSLPERQLSVLQPWGQQPF
jgi:hypothetical protein